MKKANRTKEKEQNKVIAAGLYPKICVNHKRALSEISKLMEHFDESRAYS